jgi:hypothetical protein
MPEIELTRLAGYRTDRGREYKIFIDGKKVGGIRIGEAKAFSLSPGHHELQLKVDWAASEKLQAHLGDNGRVQFVCAPRVKENDVGMVNGFRIIYWLTFGCRRYIDLRQGHQVDLVDEPNRWLQKFNGPKLFVTALVIGLAYWALSGESVVAVGIVVAGMAVVVSGLVARGIGNVAVKGTEKAQKWRRDD